MFQEKAKLSGRGPNDANIHATYPGVAYGRLYDAAYSLVQGTSRNGCCRRILTRRERLVQRLSYSLDALPGGAVLNSGVEGVEYFSNRRIGD